MSVKVSKWRQANAKLAKTDTHILNVTPTGAIWDCSNMMATNGKYLAIPWKSPGGCVVLPADFEGKLAPNPPSMIHAHTGPVIDVAFNPFNDDMLYTAGEDGLVKVWSIPAGGAVTGETQPVSTLHGHSKKVGILTPHHSAANVLAAAGIDNMISIFDVETGKAGVQIKDTSDVVQSLNFNLDGSLLNTTTKDKRVNIIDSRTGAIAASTEAHAGAKTQRSVWAKRRGLIVTFGFTSKQFRELKVWDIRNMSQSCATQEIDQASSIMLPFVDEDMDMLYVGGKGDGGVKYFHLWEDDSVITPLSAYTNSEATKGICMFPKKYMDVRSGEIARFFKMTPNKICKISIHLPRRTADTEFQEDIYRPTFADEPVIDAAAFFEGKNANPNETDLRGLFDKTELTTTASTTEAADSKPAPSPEKSAPKPPAPAPAEPKPTVQKTSPVSSTEPAPKPVQTQPQPVQTQPQPVATSGGSSASTAVVQQEAIVAYLEAQLAQAKAQLEQLKKAAPAAPAQAPVPAPPAKKSPEAEAPVPEAKNSPAAEAAKKTPETAPLEPAKADDSIVLNDSDVGAASPVSLGSPTQVAPAKSTEVADDDL